MDKIVNFEEYLKDYPAGVGIELRDGRLLYRGRIYNSREELPGGRIFFLPEAMSREEYQEWFWRRELRSWKKWLKSPLQQLRYLWNLWTRKHLELSEP